MSKVSEKRKLIESDQYENKKQKNFQQEEDLSYDEIFKTYIKNSQEDQIDFDNDLIIQNTVELEEEYVAIQENIDKKIIEEEYAAIQESIDKEFRESEWYFKFIDQRAKILLEKQFPFYNYEKKLFYQEEYTRGKIIVFFGAIGNGKSTLIKRILSIMKEKNISVYFGEEMSTRLKKEFEFFNSDKKKYAFFFQEKLLEEYKKGMENTKQLTKKYQYILMERTECDTKIFEKELIFDPLQKWYLDLNRLLTNDIKIDHSDYIKCNPKTAVKRQQKRKRDGENCESEYIKRICEGYERDAEKIYSNHTIFDSEIDENSEEYQSNIENLVKQIIS